MRAVAEQAARGITLMLPSEDALWVGEELTRRFGLPRWQFALTATDANRFAIRLARQHHRAGRRSSSSTGATTAPSTRRSRRSTDGASSRARATSGRRSPLDETTRVVEWNDLEALERELAHGDVACVLAEPALTNIGIVHPEPGFHDALREADARDRDAADHRRDAHALRRARAATRAAHGLEPDLLTVGKAIGERHRRPPRTGSRRRSPTGSRRAIGRDESRRRRRSAARSPRTCSRSRRCARRSREVLTDEAFERMIALGERFERGVAGRDRASTRCPGT